MNIMQRLRSTPKQRRRNQSQGTKASCHGCSMGIPGKLMSRKGGERINRSKVS